MGKAGKSFKQWCSENGERGSLLLSEWIGKDVNDNLLDSSKCAASSRQKAKWKCSACGHEWVIEMYRRTSKHHSAGCPECLSRNRGELVRKGRLSNSQSLFDWCSENGDFGKRIKREWTGIDANGKSVDIKCITRGSDKVVLWRCEHGHEWFRGIGVRTHVQSGCPKCYEANRSELHGNPLSERNLYRWCQEHGDRGLQLMSEWCSRDELGNPIGLDEIYAGSHINVLWRCAKGHEWFAQPRTRTSGINCPYCSGTKVSEDISLSTWCLNNGERGREVASQWTGVMPNGLELRDMQRVSWDSVYAFKWKCSKGHEWYSWVKGRTLGGFDCPVCRRLKARRLRREKRRNKN